MKIAKCIVVLNQQHTLFPQQTDLLDDKYSTIDYLRVPAAGWTLSQINDVCDKLLKTDDADIIMASPIPAMLITLANRIAYSAGVQDGSDITAGYNALVYTFHNDKRIKNQFGDKIVMTVAPDGWVLI